MVSSKVSKPQAREVQNVKDDLLFPAYYGLCILYDLHQKIREVPGALWCLCLSGLLQQHVPYSLCIEVLRLQRTARRRCLDVPFYSYQSFDHFKMSLKIDEMA